MYWGLEAASKKIELVGNKKSAIFFLIASGRKHNYGLFLRNFIMHQIKKGKRLHEL